MAQCYVSWLRVERDKNILPYLKYSTVGDQNVCSVCKKLNNILLRTDDPFWNVYFPPNCIECRCIVLQLDEAKKLTDLSKKKLIKPQEKFALNVGKHELRTLFT